jgi:hypothetical protein
VCVCVGWGGWWGGGGGVGVGGGGRGGVQAIQSFLKKRAGGADIGAYGAHAPPRLAPQ